MGDENSYYFQPIIINLLREQPDFYDASRYKTPEELVELKKESDCTREFAKRIIFERIHKMRVQALQTLIEKRRCLIQQEKFGTGSLPVMPASTAQKRGSKFNSRSSRKSNMSKSSRKSTVTQTSYQNENSSKEIVTTTTKVETIEETIDLIDLSSKIEFEEAFVIATNKYRSRHGCPPLTLSRELCQYAQDWASRCAETKTLEPNVETIYGENLLAVEGDTVDADTVLKVWYDEIGEYDFNNPVFSPTTGHFTQIVWKSSQEVGIGMASSASWTYVVAKYNPPGNYHGEFHKNVLRPID